MFCCEQDNIGQSSVLPGCKTIHSSWQKLLILFYCGLSQQFNFVSQNVLRLKLGDSKSINETGSLSSVRGEAYFVSLNQIFLYNISSGKEEKTHSKDPRFITTTKKH